MRPHLDEDDVVEVFRVGDSQAPHAVGVAPLLEVSIEVPAQIRSSKTHTKPHLKKKKNARKHKNTQTRTRG